MNLRKTGSSIVGLLLEHLSNGSKRTFHIQYPALSPLYFAVLLLVYGSYLFAPRTLQPDLLRQQIV